MVVFHFLNAKYGLSNITQRRLKIATINDVNDPFEFRGSSMKTARQRKLVKEWREEMAERFGMLCFSRTWSNPVQWSHYADGHKGLCLGFEVGSEMKTVSYSRCRLDYDLERLSAMANMGGGAEADADKAMREMLSTKYVHWRYEEEERLFTRLEEKDPNEGLYFHDFGPALNLVRIIVGAESKVTRADIASALGELAPQVATCKARLAFRTYKVIRQRKEALWQ
jgi:hypothetical protein